MKLEKLKEYLQRYLDSVVTPRFLTEPDVGGIESFTVHDILKGSYQPPIIHVFLDSVPVVNIPPASSTKVKLRQVETDIKDFIKMFSLKNPVKIHFNKKPLIKPGKIGSFEV